MRGFLPKGKQQYGYAPDPEPVPAPWWNGGSAMGEAQVDPNTAARDEYGYSDLINRTPWQDPRTAPPQQGYQSAVSPEMEYLRKILRI